jgi:Tfp pilus assembly protein PilF
MSTWVRRGVGHAVKIALAIGLLAGLSACSSVPNAEEAAIEKQALQEKVDAKVTEADVALKAGNVDQAMGALDEAMKLDPSAKQPWLKKAQYHFEKRQYGVAITEAQEVLQRDVNDNTARSILAVSGLRVSAEALDQLRKANEVTGSARTEAESVARIIREALGEPILVPPAAGAGVADNGAAKPPVRAAARSAPRPAVSAAPSPSPAPLAPAAPRLAAAQPPGGAPVSAQPAPVARVVPVSVAPAPAAVAKPRPVSTPAPAAGNGRSNPFGALQ